MTQANMISKIQKPIWYDLTLVIDDKKVKKTIAGDI